MPGHWHCKISLLFFVLSVNSCTTNKTEKVTSPEKIEVSESPIEFESLPLEFREFYTTFHKDSVYQMEHIVFPLEGLPDQADPDFIGEEKYYFTKDQWILQTTSFLNQNNYRVEYKNLSNIIIEEKIIDTALDIMLFRRFAKTADGWRLIYYAGMNKYK
ncbi:MAG: hypothetical protein M3Q56_00410 [Bacteroidota bacterium]|nr:hypothetical protein [Bacteroidota bacterium]